MDAAAFLEGQRQSLLAQRGDALATIRDQEKALVQIEAALRVVDFVAQNLRQEPEQEPEPGDG